MAHRKRNQQLDLVKYKEDSKKGVIFEADLEYPQELHNSHNDHPFAPEKNESLVHSLSSGKVEVFLCAAAMLSRLT